MSKTLLIVLVFALLCSFIATEHIELEHELDMDMEVSLPGYREQIAQQLRSFAQGNIDIYRDNMYI